MRGLLVCSLRYGLVVGAALLMLLAGAEFRLADAQAASTGQHKGLDVPIAVVRVDRPRLLPLSLLDLPSPNLGLMGAQLAIEDNQTTGRFLGHSYRLISHTTTPETLPSLLKQLHADGIHYLVILGTAEDAITAADQDTEQLLVFNALAADEALRDDACRRNLLHTAPSHAMRADALAQYLVWKRWRRWLLVQGSHPEDMALGDAYRRAASKFGAEIVETRTFVDSGGARSTDSGHAQLQRQIPAFTQRAAEFDVIVAADAGDWFAAYLPYRLWDPRPVTGSAGLRPLSWHAITEAWGATQMQQRFEKLANRVMREEDFQAWLAIRAIGEAVTRLNSAEPETVRAYLLGDQFGLAAFKGTKVTFRPWNGQLRQGIFLTDGRILVSVSPQEGFLHQYSPLDTLGLDRPESRCTAFATGE